MFGRSVANAAEGLVERFGETEAGFFGGAGSFVIEPLTLFVESLTLLVDSLTLLAIRSLTLLRRVIY